VIGELYKRLVLLDYPEELPEDAKKLPKMSYAQYYEMVKASLVEAANEFPKRWVSTDEHWNATGEVPAQLYHFEAWYNKYLAGLCTSIETTKLTPIPEKGEILMDIYRRGYRHILGYAAELTDAKQRYIEHRGCTGLCVVCETGDWCPFTLVNKES